MITKQLFVGLLMTAHPQKLKEYSGVEGASMYQIARWPTGRNGISRAEVQVIDSDGMFNFPNGTNTSPSAPSHRSDNKRMVSDGGVQAPDLHDKFHIENCRSWLELDVRPL